MFPPHSTLILLSTGVGVGLDFAGINPVKALYWTAVINGLSAPSFSPPGVSCLLCKLPISPPSRSRLAGYPASSVLDLPLCCLHQPDNNLSHRI